MSSSLIEPRVAGSPLPLLLLLIVGCTAPELESWPLDSDSRLVSSGFGPRLKSSEDARYDFHRGIDLPTPIGTPLIALEDGVVRLAGSHASYSDTVIQVAHGEGCFGQPDNCTFSGYLHVSETVVRVGDTVRAGQLLGYSGASDSGFEHLHFEMRDGSVWQQGAVNPVPWLDLHNAGPPTIHATWTETSIVIDVEVAHRDLDFEGMRAEAVDADGVVVATHPVEPAAWNRTFTHPQPEWPSPECPYASAHPEGTPYDPHIHMDDPHFHGAMIQPAPFNATSDTWAMRVSVDANLQDIDHVRVVAWDVSGGEITVSAEPSPL